MTATARTDSSRLVDDALISTFLRDVIGAEESLSPSCGRLRAIHARIGKEVIDAKNELHTTVRSEWPTLERQLGTTRSISARLKTVQTTVEDVESQVDGDDTSLRPKLQAGLASHAALKARHTESQTLVDLLAALQQAQSANDHVRTLLDQGSLEDAVPAIQQAAARIQEYESWMVKSPAVVAERERCQHLRILIEEGLQNAIDDCIRITTGAMTVSNQATVETRAGSKRIPVATVVNALAALEPLDKLFDGIVNSILAKMAEPLLSGASAILESQTPDEHTTRLTLRDKPSVQAEEKLEGVRTLVLTLRNRLFEEERIRTIFFVKLVPPLQDLVRSHILEASIPRTADVAELDRFQAICSAVPAFERENLLFGLEWAPTLAQWTAQAGAHWAQSMMNQTLSRLRAEVVAADYWNRTESVEWVEEASTASLALNGHHSVSEVKDPGKAAESAEVVRTSASQPGSGDHEPEEAAWGLDDEFEEHKTKEHVPQDASKPKHLVEESPDPNADDAWGFDAGVDEVESPSVQVSTSVLDPKLDAEGEGNAEDAGGWSFDDDAEEIASNGASNKTHSRKGSLEEDGWDAWTRPEEEQALRPIGKPTRVVKGKLGGNKTSVALEPVEQQEPIASTSKLAQPELIEPLHPVITQPAAPALPENMLISTRARAVLDLAAQSLQSAVSVMDASQFSDTSVLLVQTARNTFDLYRAVCSTAHKELINNVPSIGMQYANDCRWLAREARKVCSDTTGKGKGRQLATSELEQTLDRLRAYGLAVIDEQLELQRQPLIELLDEADGLRYTDDSQAFPRCQRSIRQIISTLERLSHAWKPVMLKRAYYESLGILVNAVLLRVLVDIENQEDISEEASHRLNELCKMLHDVEKLFMDGEVSTVALHVPVWFKFKFLSELLEASMADIMFLFNEGHLVDFSSTELTKLVVALFSDSQLRQKNLETIARGH